MRYTNPAILFFTFLVLGFMQVPVKDAHAVDLFNKSKTSTPAMPQPKDADETELLDLLDPDAQVEEPHVEPQTINDFANQYFGNCIRQDHPTLKGENLEMLCGCTAANIPKSMTVEQMKVMAENSEEGQLQRARMMLFVYTPCIEYPTEALVTDKCLKDKKVRDSFRHYQKVCKCLGESMGNYMKENAQSSMSRALKRNLIDTDPLSTLLESPEFEKYSNYHMGKCVQTHEFGRGR